MRTFKIEQTETQCVVTWRHFHCVVFFLFPFFVGWTVACVFLTYGVFAIQQLQFGVIFLGLLFWGVWFFLFTEVFDMLFGKTQFVLDKNGFKSVWTCLFFKRQKQIELAGIQQFEPKIILNKELPHTYFIRVVLPENHSDFRVSEEKDMNDLCVRLNAFLAILKAKAVV